MSHESMRTIEENDDSALYDPFKKRRRRTTVHEFLAGVKKNPEILPNYEHATDIQKRAAQEANETLDQ